MGVDEKIDVPTHGSSLVADAAVERRMAALDLPEHGAQAGRR